MSGKGSWRVCGPGEQLTTPRLATVHGYTAEALPFGRELMAAEEEAKKARKNVSCEKMNLLMGADLARLLGGGCPS